MAPNETVLGRRIAQRRQMLGMSQTKLAELAGLLPSQISRYEKGERRITEENLWKISGALGWSPEKFFTSESNVVEAGPDIRRVPLLDYVQAGQWTAIQENWKEPEDQEFISTNLQVPPSTFALRIRGESMEPMFTAGDVVVIAPTIMPLPGDYVVATDENGEATFKKYRELGVDAKGRVIRELIALNEDYPSMRSDRQSIAIVGTMIEHRRYRRR